FGDCKFIAVFCKFILDKEKFRVKFCMRKWHGIRFAGSPANTKPDVCDGPARSSWKYAGIFPCCLRKGPASPEILNAQNMGTPK
ncbi:MAG: hypothetical protein MPK62_13360, partial [Alphaproteobacteria bacterium]|nr:hypothetical protein [Alphaproteobacteria bacterium]